MKEVVVCVLFAIYLLFTSSCASSPAATPETPKAERESTEVAEGMHYVHVVCGSKVFTIRGGGHIKVSCEKGPPQITCNEKSAPLPEKDAEVKCPSLTPGF